MNSKGQTLVMFIILLPIILLMFVFTVDYGLLSLEKRKLVNNTYDAMEYYLENVNQNDVEEKTIKLLLSNLSDADVNITNTNDIVEIEVKSNYNSLINAITNKDLIIKYTGIKESKEIIKG